MTQQQNYLLRTTDIAARLNRSPKTIAAWCREKRFPTARQLETNGRWNVLSDDPYLTQILNGLEYSPHVDPQIERLQRSKENLRKQADEWKDYARRLKERIEQLEAQLNHTYAYNGGND